MCPLGHHVNTNTTSKNSDTFSFFRLDKNYFPREYDTSNKVLPNLQQKKWNDNICTKPISNSVTSILGAKSVEVRSLYCNKVYNLGPGLKHHMNRCKERQRFSQALVIGYQFSSNGKWYCGYDNRRLVEYVIVTRRRFDSL